LKRLADIIHVFRPLYIPIVNSRIMEIIINRPWVRDEKRIREIYKQRFGVEPNLNDPVNFNEKNNWRKLNDRNPYYTKLVDKYLIKNEIIKKLGEEYTFPLLGVWDRPEEIDYSKLPNRFVLKVNHAGGIIVCRDKSTFNKKFAGRKLKRGLSTDFFSHSREWPYKNVPRKIIAEEYMGENLTDYKNYCFNGKLLYTFVWENASKDDGTKPEASFCGAYDRNWEKTGIEIDYPSKDKVYEKPSVYDEMVRVAEIMSENIPFVRVDCYIINDHVYVGEMTFFPWGGFQKFRDEYWNDYLGELEVLPSEMK